MSVKTLTLIFLSLCLACVQAYPQDADTTASERDDGPGPVVHQPRRYTPNAPLIYEDVWDLPPYAFQNADGQPSGFNVDLVKLLLERLGIPYEIRLKPTPENFEDVRTGAADLTIGMKAYYHDRYADYGSTAIALFTHSIVFPEGVETDVRDFDDLKSYTVVGHKGSFSDHYMNDNGLGDNFIPVDDMKGLLMQITPKDTTRVLWNTLTLRYLIRQYDLNHLNMVPVNMPYGNYHFMSNDSVLLHKLDSVYNELNNSDAVLPLRRTWLYPEVEKKSTSYYWYITGGIVSILIVLAFYNISYYVQERRNKRVAEQQSRRLNLLLKSGNVQIWTFDVKKRCFRVLDPSTSNYEEYSEDYFSVFYDPEDYKSMRSAIDNIVGGATGDVTLSIKRRDPSREDAEVRYLELNLSVLHQSGNMPTIILGAQHDITGERLTFLKTRDNLLKYQTVFNTAMSDLTYYDGEGRLIDLNEKACETFSISSRKQLIDSGVHLLQMPVFSNLDQLPTETMWASTTINLDAMALDGTLPPGWRRKGKMSYEFSISPIYDDDRNNILWYVSAGREVTAEVTQERKEKDRINRIRRTTESIENYTRNINYALQISDIRLANYYLDSHMMVVSAEVGGEQRLELTQIKCIRLLHRDYKPVAARLLRKMDSGKLGEFNVRVKLSVKSKDHKDIWVDINGLPMMDANGKVDHYFCLCRDTSLLVDTQQRLTEETRKAQEAEKLKTSFFNNISREVRNPLNAVVGFARLFGVPHDAEDEVVFTEEIKKNSDALLELVNSVLLLSRLDSGMVESKKVAADFAELFRTSCMMGWTRCLSTKVDTIVESPYRQLLLNIDTSHASHIIETLASLAAQHTTEGQIRARYSYHDGTLTIMVDDTGIGMSPETLHGILDRTFNADDGKYIVSLKLEICLALSELMGGKMGIESELGHGTSVWVALPCTTAETESKEATTYDV